MREPGLPHEPARPGTSDGLLGVLELGVGGEEDGKLGACARQRAADGEAVLVAEAHVEEHGVGLVALDRLQCARRAVDGGNHVVAACLQQASGGLPERQ